MPSYKRELEEERIKCQKANKRYRGKLKQNKELQDAAQVTVRLSGRRVRSRKPRKKQPKKPTFYYGLAWIMLALFIGWIFGIQVLNIPKCVSWETTIVLLVIGGIFTLTGVGLVEIIKYKLEMRKFKAK